MPVALPVTVRRLNRQRKHPKLRYHSKLDLLRQMLQQGFTSARDVGGGDDTVALRNAINSGKVPGPRLLVSLEPLGPTAGHGDPYNGLDHGLSHPGWSNGIVDSPETVDLEQTLLVLREARPTSA